MAEFASFDGASMHYELAGDGPSVVLLHSFPFDSRVWVGAGVVDALCGVGRQAILLDRRGQGRSAKPHDPAAYGDNASARDVSLLLDHLGLSSSDLLAYSLGSQIGLRVLQVEPRIRRAVLGGVGDGVLDWHDDRASALADQLETDDISTLSAEARALRERVERLGGDRLALAAMWRGRYVGYDEDFSAVRAAVLIITGERDGDFGDPAMLASRISHARTVRIDADHATTMGHPEFVRQALDFLGR